MPISKLASKSRPDRKQVGVTFVKKPTGLLETKRQPYISRYNYHRHPRQSPAIFQVSITGPFDSKGIKQTPSRRRIFVTRHPPEGTDSKSIVESAARKILSQPSLSLAYRRSVTERGSKTRPMEFFPRWQCEQGGFETGIENCA